MTTACVTSCGEKLMGIIRKERAEDISALKFKHEIAAQFRVWNKTLQTGGPDKVVACYATNLILLPTLSAIVRHNHDEIWK